MDRHFKEELFAVKIYKLSLMFLLIICLSVGSTNAATVKKESKYKVYEALRNKIITFSLEEDDLIKFKELFPNSTKLHENVQKATSLKGLDNGNLTLIFNNYKKVYLEFILAEPNADVLYDYLVERQGWNNEFIRNVTSPGMNLAWYWADIAQSTQYAYEGTKQTRFLDLLLSGALIAFEYTDEKIGKADYFRNKKVDGWGFNLSYDERWETEVTLPGRIITPILKFYRLVESDPALKEEYGSKIEPIAKRGLKIIDQYLPEMIFKTNGVGYFVNLRTSEEEAVNHQAAYIQACIQAYAITGEDKYKRAVDGFYKYLMSISTFENDSYSWPYQVLKDESKTQQAPFWKESITAQMLVDMDSNGFPLSKIDKQRFSNTFLNTVGRKFASINAYITPQIEFPFTGYNVMHSDFVGASRLVYWSPMDKFDPKIGKVINDYVSTRQDLFPIGWFGDVQDATAYAYKFTKK